MIGVGSSLSETPDPYFPFSKDTNWIIGGLTGAALESGWSAQLFKHG